jgi:hypothetical protein
MNATCKFGLVVPVASIFTTIVRAHDFTDWATGLAVKNYVSEHSLLPINGNHRGQAQS